MTTITFIKPLSQNELANGWQLVVPKVINKVIKNLDENKTLKSNVYRSKINLAQLPFFLWAKRRLLSNGNSKAHHRSHYFYIEKSPVDKEITKLVNIIQGSYNPDNSETVLQLLNVLKENDIYGWVVIKATELYL